MLIAAIWFGCGIPTFTSCVDMIFLVVLTLGEVLPVELVIFKILSVLFFLRYVYVDSSLSFKTVVNSNRNWSQCKYSRNISAVRVTNRGKLENPLPIFIFLGLVRCVLFFFLIIWTFVSG